MHIGKSYTFSEFLIWTKRTIYVLLLLGIVPVILYQVAGVKWLAIPWTVVALLGTATAFIIGFKNTQTYNRGLDAQQTWMAVTNSSRAWGLWCRDFLNDPARSAELIYRHFAWLTALRYQLREKRIWETTTSAYNEAYKKFYDVPQNDLPVEDALAKYLSPSEMQLVLASNNKTAQILSLQSKALKFLFDDKSILINHFIELEKIIREFYDQQGRSERIKNYPYPRQLSIMNRFFIRLFCLLLPFGMLREFDRLNESVEGMMKGNMVWLVIPFSVIISWMYTSLEQVGESSENPFEGSANDVPVSQISRSIERELREMLGESELPPALQAKNNIIL
jgi:putative membrane protein